MQRRGDNSAGTFEAAFICSFCNGGIRIGSLSFSVRFILITHEREHILFPEENSSWELDHSLSSGVLKSLSARKSFLILHFSPFSSSLLSRYWYCHLSRKKKHCKETQHIYFSSILGALVMNLKFTIKLETKIHFLGVDVGLDAIML